MEKFCSDCKYFETPFTEVPCAKCFKSYDYPSWTPNEPDISERIIAELEKHILLSGKEAGEIVRKEFEK